MCLVPDEVLARLLVVTETKHVTLTVLTGLPGARLPVLLIVAAPVQALDTTTVITALASLLLRVDLEDELHRRLIQPEPAVSTAVRAVALRLDRAAAAAGVLGILRLLRHRAPPLVKRALGCRVNLLEPLAQDVLPVRLLLLRQRRLQLLNDALELHLRDCFNVNCFETY